MTSKGKLRRPVFAGIIGLGDIRTCKQPEASIYNMVHTGNFSSTASVAQTCYAIGR